MKLKDPVLRIGGEANLRLANLKHEALIKKNKNIYKTQIADWLIINAPQFKEVEKAFWSWVMTVSEKRR